MYLLPEESKNLLCSDQLKAQKPLQMPGRVRLEFRANKLKEAPTFQNPS
jgi:hypothetical protein